MKTMLVTTPIRPKPSNFAPIGSLNIINYLRKHDIEIDFYHIDGLRPSFDEALKKILDAKPEILGISAVVSTSYAYTKKLVQAVKTELPDTLIIVGGGLAASAEILLRIAGVDLCALGEGEKVMLNVVNRAKTTKKPSDFSDIKGLVLLDDDGNLVNTGYEDQLPKEEIYDVNWDDLTKASDPAIYFAPVDVDGDIEFHFKRDQRTYEEHRKGKNVAGLATAKGCVARCTFCHRWDKGIRYIPNDVLSGRLTELVEKHNVGFLHIVDENFGTDKRWLKAFCEMIKPFDLLWRVGGMRVNCISPEYIEMMKDAGCSAIIYGMESGSEKILQVMEKKVKLQDNYNAMKWTVDAEQGTVVQLVIGMPGETPQTIKESSEFAKYANSIAEWQRPWDLSINYAQALPGTPLYEYARRVGLIGVSLEEEEKYLIQISDTNAADENNTLNFTAYPYFIHRSWRHYIQIKTCAAYVKKFGKEKYAHMLLTDSSYFKNKNKNKTKPDGGGYFNKPKLDVERAVAIDGFTNYKEAYEHENEKLPSLISLILKRKVGLSLFCYPEVFDKIKWTLPFLWFLIGIKRIGLLAMLKETKEWLSGKMKRQQGDPDKSLRKVVFGEMGMIDTDAYEMEPLRKGR